MAGMAFGTFRFAHVGGVRIDVALVRFLGEVFVASAVAGQTLRHGRFVIGRLHVATRAGHASLGVALCQHRVVSRIGNGCHEQQACAESGKKRMHLNLPVVLRQLSAALLFVSGESSRKALLK